MDTLKIQGGTPLFGEVEVAGSKNAALAVLSAVILTDEPVVLHNVPDISDVRTKLALIEKFGANIERRGKTVTIDCSGIGYVEPLESDVRPIRTSFYLFGPLLARNGMAKLPAPGGCRIGARPVDFHLKGLALLGAKVGLYDGCYIGDVPDLKGANIYLDFPSAGATQHLMATAVLAKGRTVIQNAAMEPEVVALARFLRAMGANVEGEGTSTIIINGVDRLHGCEYRIPADRLQAGTYLLAGVMTGGCVRINGVEPIHQMATVQKLREAGAIVEEGEDWLEAKRGASLRGVRVRTMPYPGFPTDMQQPFAAALTIAEGTSVIEETIYEARIGHVAELARMGADISVQGQTVTIKGVPSLQGAAVEASDLRAGAALVLAALAAEGETVIHNIHYIDRGYEKLEETFNSLGASVRRVANRLL